MIFPAYLTTFQTRRDIDFKCENFKIKIIAKKIYKIILKKLFKYLYYNLSVFFFFALLFILHFSLLKVISLTISLKFSNSRVN